LRQVLGVGVGLCGHGHSSGNLFRCGAGCFGCGLDDIGSALTAQNGVANRGTSDRSSPKTARPTAETASTLGSESLPARDLLQHLRDARSVAVVGLWRCFGLACVLGPGGEILVHRFLWPFLKLDLHASALLAFALDGPVFGVKGGLSRHAAPLAKVGVSVENAVPVTFSACPAGPVLLAPCV
jgi:hypothetical protein